MLRGPPHRTVVLRGSACRQRLTRSDLPLQQRQRLLQPRNARLQCSYLHVSTSFVRPLRGLLLLCHAHHSSRFRAARGGRNRAGLRPCPPLLILFAQAMAQPGPPTRILLVDDDEMSRELLAVLLEAAGYAVVVADSGEAALDLLQSGPRPDIVLTDLQMPGSTPDRLAGRIRRACGRGTLLLAMSGSPPNPSALARYDGFLLKPFGSAELASAIEPARAAHLSARAKKDAATARPAKPAPTAKKPGAKKSIATLALAASAAEPASKRSMDAEPCPPAHPSLSPSAGASLILDEAIYRQLAGAMPTAQLHEMYVMCLSDARARIASMRAHAAAHDDTQFMRQAHTIKGSCGMLGATELHRIAAALEKRGPDPADSSVNSLDELSDACDRLERMLGSRA